MFAISEQCGDLVSTKQTFSRVVQLLIQAGQINDYAVRHYSGLMEFYTERWSLFFESSRAGGCSNTSSGYERFNEKVFVIEKEFANLTRWPLFSQTETDNYFTVVKTIWMKYGNL